MSKYDEVYFVGNNQVSRLTESKSILPKQGNEAHFRTRL